MAQKMGEARASAWSYALMVWAVALEDKLVRLKPLAILFHLLPLVPLYMHLPYITIAAVIFVAVPYIKVQKLSTQLKAFAAPAQDSEPDKRRKGRNSAAIEREKASLIRTIRLWQALTMFRVSGLSEDESL